NLINDNISLSSLNVKFLTEQMGMSRTPLFTKLKALTNMGINDYIKIIRIERATQLLATTTLNIAEVSDAVGLDSPKYFSTLFKQVKGITPTQFRESQ
ncbi:MAG: helix-turn-helix transcriptional regulator, partial [Bacteroides sp.]